MRCARPWRPDLAGPLCRPVPRAADSIPIFTSSRGHLMIQRLLLLAMAGLLGGCAASTQLITNDQASEAVKGKSFSTYKEVLLLPPKEDPRNVVPRVVSGIEGMGFKVQLMPPGKSVEAPQGTGFVIGTEGWLLTCAHVLADSTEATVTVGGKRLIADVVKADKKSDLALLKTREPLSADTPTLAFRTARPAAMGEDVFTIGYPLSRLLGNSARMTRGLLSATTGMRDDDQQLQVSAEIQPGNSGGPLFDKDGAVLGIINQTINPAAFIQATGGALPQNVNFAIKNQPMLDFVKSADEGLYGRLSKDKSGGLADAGKAVAKIQAGIVGPDS
eukprot:gene47236-63292_t